MGAVVASTTQRGGDASTAKGDRMSAFDDRPGEQPREDRPPFVYDVAAQWLQAGLCVVAVAGTDADGDPTVWVQATPYPANAVSALTRASHKGHEAFALGAVAAARGNALVNGVIPVG